MLTITRADADVADVAIRKRFSMQIFPSEKIFQHFVWKIVIVNVNKEDEKCGHQMWSKKIWRIGNKNDNDDDDKINQINFCESLVGENFNKKKIDKLCKATIF